VGREYGGKEGDGRRKGGTSGGVQSVDVRFCGKLEFGKCRGLGRPEPEMVAYYVPETRAPMDWYTVYPVRCAV
jgi:hypothetical protein